MSEGKPTSAEQFCRDKYDKFFMPLLPSGIYRFAEAYAESLRAENSRLMEALQEISDIVNCPLMSDEQAKIYNIAELALEALSPTPANRQEASR